jgi:hypothetical protein
MSEITSISIKINLDININGTSEIIPLTSSMIYIPPEIPTKPFFSFIAETNPKDGKKEEYVPIVPDVPLEMYPRIPIRDVKLPVHLLRGLKYKEIVQFFFNKEVFAERMKEWKFTTSQGISIPGMQELNEVGDFLLSETEGEIAQHLLSQKEIENIQVEKQNIELMMHLLFPTYMFYSEGYKTSMQYWNTAEPYLKNSFPKTFYSYLRYKNVLYTITNSVWLNDVFNMPFYQELVFYYDNYKTWKSEMLHRLRLVLVDMEKKEQKEKKEQNEENGKNGEIKSTDRNATTNNSPKITRKSIERVIEILNKRIMDKNEYDDIFIRNSDLSEVYNKYIKSMISNQGSDNDKPTYFYNMIFSIDKRESYSNSRLNEMVYFFENVEMDKKGENINQRLLGTMMDNIIDYTKNKGEIGYLKRGICKTLNKSKCRPRTELSTFYYPGIMKNSKIKNGEPMYEIYVLIDVIEGEVNAKNYSKVKCKYENQSIGKKLEFLTKQWPIWDLSNRRIYMKLNSENVLMKKSVSSSSKEKGNYSQNQNRFQNRFQNSDNNNANNNTSSPFYKAQQTVRNLIEYNEKQNEKTFTIALDDFKKKLGGFKGSYLTSNTSNVNNNILSWKLNTNNTETFLKWLQNNNKYPPPLEGETNADYKKIDDDIFTFLVNIEAIQQKNTNSNSDKITQLTDIRQNKIISVMGNIESKIKINTNKYNANNTYDSLNYVNCILNFYVDFLKFLGEGYLKNKTESMQGGGEGAVENILIPPSSMLVPLPKYMATKTRKLWLDMNAGSADSSAKKGTLKRRVG